MRCAVAAERGATEQNTAVSANSRIEFLSASTRGANIVDDNALFGAGVNVAASKGWPNRAPLIVAIGLIFEVGCAKERGPLVNQYILRLKIYHCSVRRQQD
jgi:hypothetical protein